MFQQNLGTAWGLNTAAPTVTRRSHTARGRARNRGRRTLLWLLLALGSTFLRS
jgi:hypothetical protein